MVIIFIYNFDTFIIIIISFDATTPKTTTAYNFGIVIDKINIEYCKCFSFNVPYYGIYGALYTKNNYSGLNKFAPSDVEDGYSHSNGFVLREISVSEVEYTKIIASNGISSTRLYFLRKFPEDSNLQTLHVDDKYLFVLPYSAYIGQGGHTSWDSNKEVWCAMAIDVTDEINT